MEVASGHLGANWTGVRVGGGGGSGRPPSPRSAWPLDQDGAHSQVATGRSHLPSEVAQGRLWDLLAIEEGFAKESRVYK